MNFNFGATPTDGNIYVGVWFESSRLQMNDVQSLHTLC
jgi:hypothetical protein